MKKSLRRKLIMSAIAVGAAAVGTTASTYAWFVTNSTVSSTVTGSVEESAASLYISQDGTNFGTQNVAINTGATKLSPLQMTKDGESAYSLKELNGGAASDGYISFDLYFSVQLNGVAQKIVVKTTAEDKGNQTHVAQSSVAADSTYQKIDQGQEYWENVVKTLNVKVDIKSAATAAGLAAAPVSSTAYYGLNDTTGKYDGLKYYKAVTGSTASPSNVLAISNYLTTTALTDSVKKAENTSGVDFITNISQSGYYKASFTIWMDGWDDSAFDAVASHNFDLGFTFALANNA